jgi:hypothetical protein
LMNGLGRLAKGDVIDESSVAVVGVEANETKTENVMDVDGSSLKMERMPDGNAGGGKSKKKKGKK